MKKIFYFNATFYLYCLIIIGLLFTAGDVRAEDILKAYPAPKGVELNADFSVKVRLAGRDWQDLSVYPVKVDRAENGLHNTEKAAMAYFDFSGTVEVSVTANKGAVNTCRIRPLSYGIQQRVSGNTVIFRLSKAANLSIEFNGDIYHNLHLFANPIETFVPDKSDANLLYYGPGLHELPGNKLLVTSGKTLYVAGGAILKGQVLIENAENVKVFGRGIVEGGIRTVRSKNVEVEGLITTSCFTGGSQGITVRNVKSITSYKWGDGMNVISSNDVLFDGVFNRNSDDCTTVYGTRLGFVGGCKNITMKNSTLWADVGHPILVGTHGNTPQPEMLENLNYINIDILQQNERQIDYQGCMSLNPGDSNLIKDVRFEDIRVEDFSIGQLLNIRVFFNAKYCTSPGRGVENVLFKNVSYNGKNSTASIIAGYDGQRKVKNLVFEGLRINGKLITDDMPEKPGWFKTSDMANMFIGEHVDGVVFRKATN